MLPISPAQKRVLRRVRNQREWGDAQHIKCVAAYSPLASPFRYKEKAIGSCERGVSSGRSIASVERNLRLSSRLTRKFVLRMVLAASKLLLLPSDFAR